MDFFLIIILAFALRLNRRLNYSKYCSHPSPGTSLVESKRYPLAKAFMVLI
jgi:hypothetical protein